MKLLPMLDPLAEIRRLYFTTTRATIERDFARALDLLKMLPNEDERSRATVFMHGLAQMRNDWSGGRPKTARRVDSSKGTQKGTSKGEKQEQRKSNVKRKT
jgi:hypothetical protein